MRLDTALFLTYTMRNALYIHTGEADIDWLAQRCLPLFADVMPDLTDDERSELDSTCGHVYSSRPPLVVLDARDADQAAAYSEYVDRARHGLLAVLYPDRLPPEGLDELVELPDLALVCIGQVEVEELGDRAFDIAIRDSWTPQEWVAIQAALVKYPHALMRATLHDARSVVSAVADAYGMLPVDATALFVAWGLGTDWRALAAQMSRTRTPTT